LQSIGVAAQMAPVFGVFFWYLSLNSNGIDSNGDVYCILGYAFSQMDAGD